MKRMWMGRLLRLAVSAGLIALLLWRAGPITLWQAVRLTDLRLVFASLVANVFLVGLYAYKWQMLLAAHGAQVSVRKLFGLYLAGYFFNTFLPTSIGGDVARIVLLAQDSPNRATAAASAVMDRVTGLIGLIAVALGAISLGAASKIALAYPWQLGLVLVVLAAGIGGMAAILFCTSFWQRYSAGASHDWLGLRRRTGRLLEAIAAYRDRPGALSVSVMLSVASQLGVVFIGWLFARAAHMDVSAMALLVAIPVVTLLTMLPISINGLGVQDIGFVFMLQPAGVDASTGLLFSLLWHGQRYIFGLAGGLLYAFGGFEKGISNDTGVPTHLW